MFSVALSTTWHGKCLLIGHFLPLECHLHSIGMLSCLVLQSRHQKNTQNIVWINKVRWVNFEKMKFAAFYPRVRFINTAVNPLCLKSQCVILDKLFYPRHLTSSPSRWELIQYHLRRLFWEVNEIILEKVHSNPVYLCKPSLYTYPNSFYLDKLVLKEVCAWFFKYIYMCYHSLW